MVKILIVLLHITLYIILRYLKLLNEVTIYSSYGNVYIIKYMKFNLNHI